MVLEDDPTNGILMTCALLFRKAKLHLVAMLRANETGSVHPLPCLTSPRLPKLPDHPITPTVVVILDGLLTGELIADKAYDSDPIRLSLASQGIVATIPPRVNRRIQTWYDPLQYRSRHLVENYFCDLKQFRAVATRYNKLADSYCAMVNLASWIIETRSTRRTAKAPVYKPSDRFPAYNTQLPLPLVPAA